MHRVRAQFKFCSHPATSRPHLLSFSFRLDLLFSFGMSGTERGPVTRSRSSAQSGLQAPVDGHVPLDAGIDSPGGGAAAPEATLAANSAAQSGSDNVGAGSLAGAYEARLEAIIAGLPAGQPVATAGGIARTPALGNRRNSLRASSEPSQTLMRGSSLAWPPRGNAPPYLTARASRSQGYGPVRDRGEARLRFTGEGVAELGTQGDLQRVRSLISSLQQALNRTEEANLFRDAPGEAAAGHQVLNRNGFGNAVLSSRAGPGQTGRVPGTDAQASGRVAHQGKSDSGFAALLAELLRASSQVWQILASHRAIPRSLWTEYLRLGDLALSAATTNDARRQYELSDVVARGIACKILESVLPKCTMLDVGRFIHGRLQLHELLQFCQRMTSAGKYSAETEIRHVMFDQLGLPGAGTQVTPHDVSHLRMAAQVLQAVSRVWGMAPCAIVREGVEELLVVLASEGLPLHTRESVRAFLDGILSYYREHRVDILDSVNLQWLLVPSRGALLWVSRECSSGIMRAQCFHAAQIHQHHRLVDAVQSSVAPLQLAIAAQQETIAALQEHIAALDLSARSRQSTTAGGRKTVRWTDETVNPESAAGGKRVKSLVSAAKKRLPKVTASSIFKQSKVPPSKQQAGCKAGMCPAYAGRVLGVGGISAEMQEAYCGKVSVKSLGAVAWSYCQHGAHEVMNSEGKIYSAIKA